MEDTQDKVRRNVVTGAFGIILIQFFQLQIKPSTFFGVLDATDVPQWKFWTLVTAVLIYLFFRYWFDDATRKQRDDAWKEYLSFRNSRIEKRLKSEMLGFLKNGSGHKSFFDLSDLVLLENKLQILRTDGEELRLVIYIPSNVWGQSGALSCHFDGIDLNLLPFSRSLEGVPYQLSTRDYVQSHVLPILQIITITKSNFDFLIPQYLTIIALGICVYRLFSL